jgi:hypothetical protein
MQALHDIVQAGYARYIGMSSCYAWQFQLMQRGSPDSVFPCCLCRLSVSVSLDSGSDSATEGRGVGLRVDCRVCHPEPTHPVHQHAELP